MTASRQPRSCLASIIPEKMDREAVNREGWQGHSILVVSAHDPRLDFIQREFVKQIGEKLYGRKK